MTDSEKLDLLIAGFSELKAEVDLLHTFIENEIRGNILLLAKGHTDLSRSLNEVKMKNHALEMVQLRLNALESKIRFLEAAS